MAHRSYILIILLISVIMTPMKAQDAGAIVPEATVGTSIVTRINSPDSRISVEAPEALLDRVVKVGMAEETEVDDAEAQESEHTVVRTKGGKTVGYRVQVYADNNARSAKTEARQRERAVGQAFPELGTYVSYVSPYWRLRVGDFKSQYDAEKTASDLRRTFPRYAKEVRVVRDRINVR